MHVSNAKCSSKARSPWFDVPMRIRDQLALSILILCPPLALVHLSHGFVGLITLFEQFVITIKNNIQIVNEGFECSGRAVPFECGQCCLGWVGRC